MKKAIISVTAFNFIGAGITFAINVLLARIFPFEVFGRINLLLSFNAILIMLFEFGFTNSMVLYYNKHKKRDVDYNLISFLNVRYIRYLLWMIPLFTAIVYGLHYSYSLSFLEVGFLFASTFLVALYRYLNTYYQAFGNWKKYNILNVTLSLVKGGVLVLGGVIIALVFRRDLTYHSYLVLYILYVIILFVIGVASSFALFKYKDSRDFDKKKYYNTLLPLGMVNIIIALAMRLDNVIIENSLGINEVAIYSAANTLALVFPLITGSIMRVLLKEVSKDSTKFITNITAFQRKNLLLLVLVIATSYFISPYIIQFIFGPKYSDAVPIFQILIIAYIGGIYFTPLESYYLL